MVNDIATLRKFCEDQIVQKTLERKRRKESTVKKKGHEHHEVLEMSTGAKSTHKNIVVTPKGTDRPGDELEGKSGK